MSFGVLGPMTGNSVLRRVEWDFRTRAACRTVAFVGTVAVYTFVIDVIDFLLACRWKRWGRIRLMANRRNVPFFVFGLCCLRSVQIDLNHVDLCPVIQSCNKLMTHELSEVRRTLEVKAFCVDAVLSVAQLSFNIAIYLPLLSPSPTTGLFGPRKANRSFISCITIVRVKAVTRV